MNIPPALDQRACAKRVRLKVRGSIDEVAFEETTAAGISLRHRFGVSCVPFCGCGSAALPVESVSTVILFNRSFEVRVLAQKWIACGKEARNAFTIGSRSN